MLDSILSSCLTPVLADTALLQDLQTLLKSPIAALIFIFAVGALGLYMLLPGEQTFSASAVNWFAGPLMAISLVLLASLLIIPASWWPPIPDDERVSRIAFVIPAVISLTAAVLAVTARRMTTCPLWLAVLLASNSVLFYLHGTLLPTLANTVLAVLTLAAWRFAIVPALRATGENNESSSRPPSGGEPFLACATGALLCVVLIACITRATGGATKEPERLARTMATKRDTMAADKREPVSTESNRSRLMFTAWQSLRERPIALLSATALVLSSAAGAVCFAARPRNARLDGNHSIDGDLAGRDVPH